MEKFVALFDVHWGYERDSQRHKVALHDERAVSVAMQFIEDFKPQHVILGGDILDCGSVSHHRLGVTGQVEGLRILSEAKECREAIIKPLEQQIKGRLVYHIGNHEDWLNDLVDKIPSLEGIVDIKPLLNLNDKWEIIPVGKSSRLGKLTFVHGDTVKGGGNPAAWAVNAYERNVRFGHYHTFQISTKNTPVDQNGHTGISVPCLAKKGHRYGGGTPNRWMQGFLFGYVNGPEGTFNDYVAVIVNGRATINAKTYKG